MTLTNCVQYFKPPTDHNHSTKRKYLRIDPTFRFKHTLTMFSPISCGYCRKRKVRCSKEESGCQACLKRNIKCEYPTKFRSIELVKLKSKHGGSQQQETIMVDPMITDSPSEFKANNLPPTAITSDEDKVHEIQSDIALYKVRIAELEAKLNVRQDFLSIFENSFTDSKHYGCNSINSLEFVTMAGTLPFNQRSHCNYLNSQKKRFPRLIDNDAAANVKLVLKFVDMFFNKDEFNYFADLYNKEDVVKFVEGFEQIQKWNHDEDMIILLAILIDITKNLLNKIKEEPVFPSQGSKVRSLVAQYQQIISFQEVETISTLKSQLIVSNYFYYIMEFEKCWSLLFQATANAYSLGLHITQGPVWIKLNLLESVFASVSSRPNCIQSFEKKKLAINDPDDEFQEIKFAELLREKNRMFIGSHVTKKEIGYNDDIFQIGLKFEVYTKFLNDKIDFILSDKSISKTLKNQKLQKAYFLLAMNCSCTLKLHFEYFETEEFSDDKCLKLLGEFISILEASTFSKLHNLRDKFSALECLMYQCLLIFLRLLNHKSVLYVLRPSVFNNGSSNGEDRLLSQLKVFKEYQRRLDLIFAKNPLYTNPRGLKAYEIISNVNLDEIHAGYNLIPSTLSNCSYTPSTIMSQPPNGPTQRRNTLQNLLNPDTSSESTTPRDMPFTTTTTTDNRPPFKDSFHEDVGLRYFVTDEIKALLDDKSILASLTDITEIQKLDCKRGYEY